ncbi:MAG: T9SS type A sorting domain-containing protein [Ignavibacteria bacterium]
MTKRLLIGQIMMFFIIGIVFAGNHAKVGTKIPNDLNENQTVQLNKTILNYPLVLEGTKSGSDYWFGPEVAVTGCTGFYDYQTNGDAKHQINRSSSTELHAVMMVSTDSTDQNGSRRSTYSFSDDDGATWTFITQVPTIRSGFVSLEAKTTGEAVVANHYQPASVLNGFVSYDVAPGAGSFTGVGVTHPFIWPGLSRYSNGNMMVAGESYTGGAGTDTGAVCVFNTTTNTMSPTTLLFNPDGVSQTNMRWTYAAGPGGAGIYVIDAISDVGGNFGLSRIYIFKTTNSGATWDNGAVMFNPIVVGTDTLAPFFGLDAIYDAAGNYYVAFNTNDPTGNFSAGKMWVSKNSGTPVLVAQHSGVNGIPGAANLVLHADAGICTIDHPALSLSADGTTIFCAYSVQFEADTLNGFNKCHIFYSASPTATLLFGSPIQVTNSGAGSKDERYVSLHRVAPDLGGSFGVTLYMMYQKDTQPGSCAFNDAAPITRSQQIFRKIYNANIPIGISNIGNEVPKNFSLSQNFPNPFNPVTKIRFSVPKASNITLQVYDAAGRLVATLANNESVTAGLKEVDFNAINLPSGVYFYTLKSADFTDTKKMVLVK